RPLRLGERGERDQRQPRIGADACSEEGGPWPRAGFRRRRCAHLPRSLFCSSERRWRSSSSASVSFFSASSTWASVFGCCAPLRFFSCDSTLCSVARSSSLSACRCSTWRSPGLAWTNVGVHWIVCPHSECARQAMVPPHVWCVQIEHVHAVHPEHWHA